MSVNVVYEGIVLARDVVPEGASEIAGSWFVPLAAPMPVGTRLAVEHAGRQLAARVARVMETGPSGVFLVGEAGQALSFDEPRPAPAIIEAAPAEPPAPTVVPSAAAPAEAAPIAVVEAPPAPVQADAATETEAHDAAANGDTGGDKNGSGGAAPKRRGKRARR